MAAFKKREGSHQVLVIQGSRSSGKSPDLHIVIYSGDNPTEEEHVAFQQLLFAVKRLKELTRDEDDDQGSQSPNGFWTL